MDTEIEIKLFVAEDVASLPGIIESAAKVVAQSCKKLGNVYFDTPSRDLRKLDMGLRVRSVEGQNSASRNTQTIKTAGRVMGGLHQRPEYNVEIDEMRPTLSLFPQDIWPMGTDLAGLQQELSPLFSTHFQRQTWQLRFDDGSEVEVAYDTGAVEANQLSQPIHELEFELLKGRPEHLFMLAKEVCAQSPVRLGHQSKAARGYFLASGAKAPKVKAMGAVPVKADHTIEQALETTLGSALQHIQDHEQIFIDSENIDALSEVLKGFSLFREALSLFQPAISADSVQLFEADLDWLEQQFAWVNDALACEAMLADKGYYLRKVEDRRTLEKKLATNRLSMPSAEAVKQLFHSSRYTHFILSLTEWMFEQGWRRYHINDQTQLNDTVVELARQRLSAAWERVKRRYSEPLIDQQACLDALQPLQTALFTGVCFRHIFDPEALVGYRTPWLDIFRGSVELQQLAYLCSQADSERMREAAQFQRWYARKRDSLCHAIEQSRLSAEQMEPYWI